MSKNLQNLFERFLKFIIDEKIQSFVAFIFYVPFILMAMKIDLPVVLINIYGIIALLVELFTFPIYIDLHFDQKAEKATQRIKKITKELLMFIPVFMMSACITSFIMIGEPANETSINLSFFDSPIYNSIYIVIIGPIIEELIFRLLPYKFIKNKILYIIISSVIFAAMHVINDPNPFYYIWFYMLQPLYYAYRYYETKDILVPISMHSFNNLIAVLLLFIF